MNDPRAHAQHNIELFKRLKDDKGFRDWAVITAFYGSIFFFDHFIFPAQLPDPKHPNKRSPVFRNYSSFQEYLKAFPNDTSVNPHKIRTEIIEEVIVDSNLIIAYKTLKKYRRRFNYYYNPAIPDLIYKECCEAIRDIIAECDVEK